MSCAAAADADSAISLQAITSFGFAESADANGEDGTGIVAPRDPLIVGIAEGTDRVTMQGRIALRHIVDVGRRADDGMDQADSASAPRCALCRSGAGYPSWSDASLGRARRRHSWSDSAPRSAWRPWPICGPL